MLKKLQRKFILITMSLVSLVLLLVFGALMISSYRQNVDEIESAMRRAMQQKISASGAEEDLRPEIGRQPAAGADSQLEERKTSFTPTVTVIVDEDGLIRVSGKQLATIDDAILPSAVQLVLESSDDSGILSDYDLRYLRESRSPGEIRIVFADRSHELSNMRHLLLSSLLIGGFGLLAFFLISLGLSRWALRPVENAWEQQRQFIADASHELKTPLTVILANTGILQKHPQDTIAAQSKWLESTQEESQRMKKLIDDMLFLAKNDADRFTAPLEPMDLSDTLCSCLLSLESVAYERGVAVESRIDPGIRVQADAAQIKQLIWILLDNACKYSSPHTTITVTLQGSAASAPQACLSVHNWGDPIPPQALPHIFERFYRSESSRARTQSSSSPSGYGLGLSIAKAITDRHRGSLTAASSAAEGTTFTLRLPALRQTS